MFVLEGKNLTFGYEDRPLIENVDIGLSRGECIALTGPSGCGKSTLCYILSGIIPRSINGEYEGDVNIFAKNIKELSLEEITSFIGIVFQNPDSQLFSPTVEDELAFGPENMCLPIDEIKNRIDYALEKVGMEKYRLANPAQLSGGQKQLIALAAVLVLKPEILIFDEALSQLDSEATLMVSKVVEELKKDGKSIIMVEHDNENLKYADRVFTFRDRKLVEVDNE